MKAKQWRLLRGLALTILFTLSYSASAFYDPTIGRWISRDPIGERGGNNVYAFVGNNAIARWDNLGLKCCLITYAPGTYTGDDGNSTKSWFGHQVLQCDNPPSYVSLFPGEGSKGGVISQPGDWHTPGDDERSYPNANPSKVCFDCLDENKVADWLANAKANHMEWNFGNECADAASQAVAAGLGDQSKPKCPCSGSADQRWVVVDLLDPDVGIVMPSHMEKQVQEVVNNGCNRYKCVLQKLHHGRAIN